MPWVKVSAKHSRREMTPPSSSEENAPQPTRIDRCPVLVVKNIDLASFNFDALSFHIEDLFDGQWVAKSKGFDDESGPYTLPFEGGEEMDKDEDDPPSRPRSHRPSSSTSALLSPKTITIYLMAGSTPSLLQ
ncbi:hypothetical protein Adt_41953 [Abeliophyllum distichum]|uniref:Uncharacterized protein n=1 Tax=Abeliophyllum distichum TaxID=126358 RepID=A0ABD1PR73_9LAMI